MKKYLISFVILLVITSIVKGQGCVAIRSNGGFCTAESVNRQANAKWSLNVNARYFKSFRHFVGTEEQVERMEQGTEVINYSTTVDFYLVRNLNERFSLALGIPVISNARSSLYEHGRLERHSTHSFGIGDIRFSAYGWLIDPLKHRKGNVQVGLGIKLPTGDYKYEDFFHTADGSKVLGPVDQSIQLGDGGTGFTAEVNAYYTFNNWLSTYGNFYYLLNPREQNGTSTSRGGPPSPTAITYGSSTMSVPDQYMIRAGVNITSKNFVMSMGFRDECLPSKDLVGGSSGFRRPGYIISFEPGLTYNTRHFSVYTYVPVAMKRSRTQSYADLERTKATGVYAHGDAAFADYAINLGLSFRF